MPGIGEKSAAALVNRFGTVAAAMAALDRGEDVPFAGKLAAARDYLSRAPVVVQVATDVPLPVYDDALPAAPRDPTRLVTLADRWALDSALNRLLAALAAT